MATAKKPAAAKGRSTKQAGKATQTRSGAGPAVAARSKDAKPAFGKAAPKKVVPATESKASKPATASKSAVGKTAPKAKAGDGSVVSKVARVAKATASVAVGAVVATARLATPSRKRKDGKPAK